MRWLAAASLAALTAPAAASGAVYTVTTPNDAGACEGTSCASLRAALAAAGDGDTIRLPDHGSPYSQQQGPFVIAASITLVGDGADRTVISGGGTERTFEVDDPQAQPTVVMAHLQVADGRDDYGYGGNIRNYAKLTLDHVRVTRGQAGSGGGIANRGFGSLLVTHSLIDNNRADSDDFSEEGGGLYSDSSASDALVVRDSTIAYNTAESSAGVLVQYFTEGQAQRSAVLERVTIARNHAASAPAGGLSISGGAQVSVSGSLLAENTSPPPGTPAAAAPSNCGALGPQDAGGNLAYPDDCGFGSPADPQLSAQLVEGLGETPVLTIPGTSPAVDRAGECTATDQRDLARPQGDRCDAGAFELAVPVIDAGPAGQTGDASATFVFSSPDPGATFECRLDGPGGAGAWERCVSPKTYASLAPGSYAFAVRATGASASALRAFNVAVAPLPLPPPPANPAQVPPAPTPQYRKSVTVKPTKGTVKVRLPGTKRYVALDRLDGLPFGASIDVRKGRVRLYAVTDSKGTVQAASFYGGVFRIVQRGRFIELQLRGPKPVCGTGARASTASASTHKPKKAKKNRRTRRLWGSGKGKFRTRGQYSAATIRGTTWLVEDSCRSTTTRVKRGVVKVRDFKRKRTIVLRAGDRYVARKR